MASVTDHAPEFRWAGKSGKDTAKTRGAKTRGATTSGVKHSRRGEIFALIAFAAVLLFVYLTRYYAV